jgi:muramoyltetrapeptide carboxypeptidase
MPTVCPPFLRPDDEVCIISTARKVDPGFIDDAKGVLESWGLKVRFGQNLFGADNQFSGTDNDRLNDLNDAIRDPEIKAIFCARGGYGTARICDGMDMKALSNQPTWIVGYSDITALHSHIYRNLGLCTIHGSMPINFSQNTPEALHSLRALMTGSAIKYSAPNHQLNRNGSAEGQLIGGNLSVLFSLLKSPSEMDFNGCVLFIEDLDEYLYHVDRMMLNLKRAGILANLAGLVVGGMTDMRDNTIPFGKTAEEIVSEHVSDYDYPVCFGFPAGHIDDNQAWIHGKKIRLVVNDNQPSLINYS